LEHAGGRLDGREAEDPAAAERVEEVRLRVLVQEHEPTVRGPDAAAVGEGLREAAEGEGGLVLEAEEATAMANLVLVERKHQQWRQRKRKAGRERVAGIDGHR